MAGWALEGLGSVARHDFDRFIVRCCRAHSSPCHRGRGGFLAQRCDREVILDVRVAWLQGGSKRGSSPHSGLPESGYTRRWNALICRGAPLAQCIGMQSRPVPVRPGDVETAPRRDSEERQFSSDTGGELNEG